MNVLNALELNLHALSGVLGYFLRRRILLYSSIFLTHKVFAPVLISIVIGYTITFTTSLGYFALLFPKDYTTSSVKNILIDFYKTFNITLSEEEGYYCTIEQIIDTIKDLRANEYERWQVEEFLKKQTGLKIKDGKYLLSANEI